MSIDVIGGRRDMWGRIAVVAVIAAACSGCAGPHQTLPSSAPPAVYFRQDWCPNTDDLVQLGLHLRLVRSGCCVYKGEPHSAYGVEASALHDFADRVIPAGDPFSRCVGVDPAELDRQRSEALAAAGRRQKDAADAADALAAQHVLELEQDRTRPMREAQEAAALAARRALEREQERTRPAREAKARRDRMTALSALDLCSAIGRALRTSNKFIDEMQAEAQRRHLDIDVDLAKSKRIRIGDRECQVYASWGAPESRNRTITRAGERAQLVYGVGSYVYTEDGIVTAVQN